MSFAPRFTVTHPITAALTRIERARGFLDAAKLSEDWIRRMGERALVLAAHHTTRVPMPSGGPTDRNRPFTDGRIDLRAASAEPSAGHGGAA